MERQLYREISDSQAFYSSCSAVQTEPVFPVKYRVVRYKQGTEGLANKTLGIGDESQSLSQRVCTQKSRATQALYFYTTC